MIEPARILVTGGQGRLGQALAALGCRAMGRAELNVLDEQSIANALDTAQPLIVINAAAYTAVDQAESDRDAAYALNGIAAGWLADACTSRGMPMIQISTDCVFGDADPEKPLKEEAEPDPLSVYGASKLEGEKQAARDGVTIARVAWLFDEGPDTFIGKMLKVAQGRDNLSIVDDEWGRPTPVSALAAYLIPLADLILSKPETVSGLLHLGPRNAVSRYGWAERLFAQSKRLGGPAPSMGRVGAEAFPTPARRPRGLILDVSEAEALLGPMAPWEPACGAAVAALI